MATLSLLNFGLCWFFLHFSDRHFGGWIKKRLHSSLLSGRHNERNVGDYVEFLLGQEEPVEVVEGYSTKEENRIWRKPMVVPMNPRF
jgi:hypothetical protein